MQNCDDKFEYWKKNYRHIGNIQKIERFKESVNSTNFKIYANNSSYVLHNYTDGSTYEKINKMCAIQEFCIKHKVKVQKPIKNSKNSYIDYKKNFFLTKFYVGNTFKGKKNELLNIAKELAALHKILYINKIPFNFRLNHNNYRILTSRELQKVTKIIHQKKTITKLDKLILNHIDFFQKILNDYKMLTFSIKILNLPKQLIHHDLHPKNVIFVNDKVSAIIDFSNMRKGNVLEDISFVSYRFSSYKTTKISESKKNISLFLQKYLEFNPIKSISDDLLQYFLLQKILARLSLIIRKNYFSCSDIWAFDFDNHLRMLKHASNSKIFSNTV